MEIVYHIKPFAELSVGELHAAASLRERVFYLEQHVTTLDADEKDPFSLFLWAECEGQTVGFLRMIPRGIAYAEPSIGRVCVARTYRRRGICREMVSRAIGYMVREGGSDPHFGPKLFDTLLRIIRIRGRIGRIPGSGHSA
jgi:ElaA protein